MRPRALTLGDPSILIPNNGGQGNLRAMFESHSNSITVYTTHEQAKQAAYSQELLKGSAIDRTNLQDPEDHHVHHHRPLSSPPVSGQAKESSAHTSQEQRQSDGGRDSRIGLLVVLGELHGLNGQGVEVEGICGPSCKADEEEDPAS